jgi:hypothetical protein
MHKHKSLTEKYLIGERQLELMDDDIMHIKEHQSLLDDEQDFLNKDLSIKAKQQLFNDEVQDALNEEKDVMKEQQVLLASLNSLIKKQYGLREKQDTIIKKQLLKTGKLRKQNQKLYQSSSSNEDEE